MLVTFENPQRKINNATLNDEQIQKLRELDGYKILNIEVCKLETQSEEQHYGEM